MKRLFSFILAMTLIFSLSVTANAAYADSDINKPNEIIKISGDGKITITNATVGEEYIIYKVFDSKPNIVKKEVDGVMVDVVDGIIYTIDPATDAYKLLFGSATPTNEYFDYNTSTHAVTRKATKTDDKELISYLQGLFEDSDKASKFPSVKQTAENKTLVFDQLVHGYYLVQSGLGTVVSINSNTPTVEVIDKNQTPGTGFKKEVSIKGSGVYSDTLSANIGDLVTYRITFEATNYTGDQLVKYYEVFDEKGNGIWAEFDSFKVWINDVPLKNGHYMNHGGVNTGPWSGIDWVPGTPNIQKANWYLVHTGFDSYSILIPWLSNHTVADVEPNQYVTFPDDATSKFDATVTVRIEYDAVIEPNANVGGDTENLFNKAEMKWTTANDTTPTKPDYAYVKTYGIGILKEDGTSHKNLEDAKFRVWKNYDPVNNVYSGPVYVIPTGIDGVYMLDSKGTPGENVSGTHMLNAREYFQYLRMPDGTHVGGEDSANWKLNQELAEMGSNQDNVVVSQVNGKLVILGLAMGTYYLEEFEAPPSYNALNGPVTVQITDESMTFDIFAEADGDVADVQVAGSLYNHYKYAVTQKVVQNSKGTQLPSTGGEGTVMMITVGTMIAIAFAVLMITQKKMSIYHD